MRSERAHLGRGVIFGAHLFENYQKVAKFTYWPWIDLHNPETISGARFLQRMEHDHKLIQEFLGQDFVRGTHLIASGDLWWVVQDFYSNSAVSSFHPQLEIIKPQLCNLAEKNKKMVSETGFSLDLCGLGIFGKVPWILSDRKNWILTSLTVIEGDGKVEIRILDTSLLWTRMGKNPDLMILPHENLAWKLNEAALKLVQGRTGISFI